MLRTHTCGQLTAADVGKEVVLCGWVHSRRDHGKLIFIDLRDRYGLTQVTFIPRDLGEDYQKAKEIRSEFVLKVTGKVNPRPQGTVNPKLPTGAVELIATSLEILNTSLTPPFEVSADNLDVTEEMRLKYRYLDLRRRSVFENFVLRHKLYSVIRNFLNGRDFIECETPILTKSTPEGARDYLVPSRLNPGEFYALPQSPQLFKQILMVSGIEKYYQIAKCFRDEDLRADRQPEFTQLDLEMSFINEEDIYAVFEQMMQLIFKELKGIELKIPFPRVTYAEAMAKHNSDKPDMRKEWNTEFAFLWVVDFPLFKYNNEEKRWESEHHPFTNVHPDDIALMDTDLGKVRSRSYDLVLNGTEIGSGSIRIHDQKLQRRIFEIIGIQPEEAQKRFGFLLEAFQFGAPPHGGFAFGIDRLLAIIAGQASIREVIGFPKTQKAFCPMTSAPSEVDAKQLAELHIAVKKK
ncbi:MAG TPA: aspartate--tRNA ligase [Candidatus Omnitrophota bacterium]|nr:aspartate--tRNA ligase [Candidatus Omnitrophota bacterium]HRZ14881.1 aspartate--tRNA ligase [Candidatus Omnitrophota bacterium]